MYGSTKTRRSFTIPALSKQCDQLTSCMSLRRHVCRLPLRLTPPSDHIWISEDALDRAIYQFARPRIFRRHVGLAPGPLEARKRATKRRMMNLAQVGGEGGPDPSVLPGFGVAPESGWQWQGPAVPKPREDGGTYTRRIQGSMSSKSADK